MVDSCFSGVTPVAFQVAWSTGEELMFSMDMLGEAAPL
jgi:hypothetical protein